MRHVLETLVGLAAAAVLAPHDTAPVARQMDRREPGLLHHLHLAGGSQLAGMYARLFRPDSIVRGVFWGVEGIQGRRFHLLFSPGGGGREPDAPSGIWHFGWGQVSLGESYADHYRREVNWRPPYASLEADFHIHLRSRNPRQAAEWYRDALGAVVEWQGIANASNQVDAVAALVRFDPIVLAMHGMPADERLVPSRTGGTADHLAFLVRDPHAVKGAARPGAEVLTGNERFTLRDLPSVFIAGPDDVIVELLQAPRGPGFWQRH
jgi:catechol 2,3-dioxygenase-like lactoylglutathione lyase family enzyme